MQLLTWSSYCMSLRKWLLDRLRLFWRRQPWKLTEFCDCNLWCCEGSSTEEQIPQDRSEIRTQKERICLALQEQGAGLEPSKSSTSLLPVASEPKRKLKELFLLYLQKMALWHWSLKAVLPLPLPCWKLRLAKQISLLVLARLPAQLWLNSRNCLQLLPQRRVALTKKKLDKGFWTRATEFWRRLSKALQNYFSYHASWPEWFCPYLLSWLHRWCGNRASQSDRKKDQKGKGLKRPATPAKKRPSAKAKSKASKKKEKCTEAVGISEGASEGSPPESAAEAEAAASDADGPNHAEGAGWTCFTQSNL